MQRVLGTVVPWFASRWHIFICRVSSWKHLCHGSQLHMQVAQLYLLRVLETVVKWFASKWHILIYCVSSWKRLCHGSNFTCKWHNFICCVSWKHLCHGSQLDMQVAQLYLLRVLGTFVPWFTTSHASGTTLSVACPGNICAMVHNFTCKWHNFICCVCWEHLCHGSHASGTTLSVACLANIWD